MVIPSTIRYTIKKTNRGYPVWAVQRALSDLGIVVEEDAYFGSATDLAVQMFQAGHDLVVDGVFGPASSAAMARTLEKKVPTQVPDGLLHGLVEGESGNLIAAVNWSVAGGVDCGYCQRRVYADDYTDELVVKRAFDGLYQMELVGVALEYWHGRYFGRAAVPTHRKAWRLATLRHNYQWAADRLSEGEWKTSYSTSPQQWVIDIGVEGVETPREWAFHYMDKMTRYVSW